MLTSYFCFNLAKYRTMNGFKNWLFSTEGVASQSQATINQMFPGAPAWVRKDLFHDNWLKKNIQHAVKAGSRTPFTDWQNNPFVQQFKNINWPEKPTCVQVSPTSFCPQTITDFIVRRFGKKAMNTRAWSAEQDAHKTDTQCDVMSKLSNPCNHVPVIMVRNQDGKYRLLEGWHRMMCRLVEGCPDDKKQLLYAKEPQLFQLWDALEPHSWQPVFINAYIGEPIQTGNNTGIGGQSSLDADTPTSVPHGNYSPTGNYVPQQSYSQASSSNYTSPTSLHNYSSTSNNSAVN